MCDYSIDTGKTIDAQVGDDIVSSNFGGRSLTRGFQHFLGDANCAVCCKPGTEIAFEENIRVEHPMGVFERTLMHKTAIFRQIDMHNPQAHHDVLELPDGKQVLVARLCLHQRAKVLTLPAKPLPAPPVEDEAPVKAEASTDDLALRTDWALRTADGVF